MPADPVFPLLPVAEVTPLCADAAAITFDVPPGQAGRYAFRAGQSLTLRRVLAGRDERRTYSICAAEGRPPRIGVREVPGGLFSRWLVHDVRPGDRIEVAPPAGRFTPPPGAAGHHVLVAAGSGITPVLSIATTLLAAPQATVTVLYGNRRASTVMFADELAELKDRYPARVELVHVLSREPRDVPLFSGRLDVPRLRALIGALIDPAGVAGWWLCGPLDLVTGARAVLTELGVPSGSIHRELFYVATPPPPPVRPQESVGVGCAVTVVLDGRRSTVTVPPGQAILDGAQRVRPDLPFACKGGVCGTCRARLVEGRVQMRRNYALEPAELAAGYVLTCQSDPCTDTVTVDYDG